MQLLQNPIYAGLIIGHILSFVLAILFGIYYRRGKISITATVYSCGAFLTFEIGSIVFTGGLLIGLHSLIGLLGGFLLVGFSCIQAIYDLKKGKE
ncbi:MAG: hypothetical protein E4H14_06680 [Candidatus Thorarchaeota archaeon]|nr:MAG: hypothetical protein E4H14_06680 [Candidatus Thorarchaeota archaeon]